ncbi:K+ transport systems, NAD-binding component [Desulfamplus magnetovallimortis]|uniref:Trk system potassium uptake protein TrkA n=1 Tax=Desulfamplus magnetovallimortis TaxID=1246637 RepID=A0A1W1HA67_9BACT|nr:Trk system potassium transporter TrkA [Desulfamplus magnetovallimortis]SLM29333.1 K+ transport systems, NAD-binding component [Desulfamplus magnetovallimortis]
MKVIIVGAGEVGYHIASRLASENKNVVVIDKDPDSLRRVSENLDVQVINASGSSPTVLEEAGIKSAEILLAVTNSDESNLVACLVANMLSPATKKLARIRSSDYDDYHEMFKKEAPYIDTVINPEIEVVNTIQRLMKVPCAVDMGELAGGRVIFVGLVLDEKSPMSGVKLMDFGAMFGQSRPLIAAVVRNEELIVPRGHHILEPGDLIYFICEHGRLEETLRLFDKDVRPVKRVMIVGGGRIGHRLAKSLESQAIQTKIIESDMARCKFLAERMNKTIVLNGDGSDQKLLIDENVRDTDVVIALTHDEETNILVSLLAKNLGAHTTITKVSKFSYFPLMSTIGLKKVVSPRLSAISTILHDVRKGKVLTAVSLLREEAEMIEAMALETSAITGKPLKKIAFPKGAILVSIIRNDIIMIPTGESIVEHGDKIIIFARRQAVSKLEKMLTVKLEFF